MGHSCVGSAQETFTNTEGTLVWLDLTRIALLQRSDIPQSPSRMINRKNKYNKQQRRQRRRLPELPMTPAAGSADLGTFPHRFLLPS